MIRYKIYDFKIINLIEFELIGNNKNAVGRARGLKGGNSEDQRASPFAPTLPMGENVDFEGLQFSPMRGDGFDDEGEDTEEMPVLRLAPTTSADSG